MCFIFGQVLNVVKHCLVIAMTAVLTFSSTVYCSLVFTYIVKNFLYVICMQIYLLCTILGFGKVTYTVKYSFKKYILYSKGTQFITEFSIHYCMGFPFSHHHKRSKDIWSIFIFCFINCSSLCSLTNFNASLILALLFQLQ